MTKILYLDWNSFAGEYMKEAWKQAGITVVAFPFPFNKENDRKNTRMDEELTKSLVMTLMSDSFDALFSFNYFPIAAMAAKACRIRYISWVYDSPYIQLYSKTIFYPTNDIRVFDRAEVRKLRTMGANTVSYLPMAADVEYYDTLVTNAEESFVNKYSSDISFVGAMYTEPRQQLYARLTAMSEYDKGYLEGIIEAQKHLYGQKMLEELLTPELIARMEKASPVYLHPDGFETKAWVYADYYLYRHVTAKERTEIMTLLSEKGYDLKIYTHRQKETDENADDKTFGKLHLSSDALAHMQGTVDYYKEAPFVYNNSKINLNISLRSIGTGIPLRAFDIMGCGGFLLTNYQEDFLEFFTPNEDFVYYTDYEDLLKKIDYYLTHDKEREKIARNGYEKVKEKHTFKNRVLDLQKRFDAFP